MPFGMGPLGWFYSPYYYSWMGRYPHYSYPFWFPFYPVTKEEQKRALEMEAKMLEEQLEAVKKRLSELEK
ncbi:MAG: DUF5320 domain-containing protein [Thermodesulfobacteriota bacterium]